MNDSVRPAEPTTADLEARRAARRYPDRPIVAVLAVVVRGEQALIVQRAQQPNAGRWGFPGGVLELGETVGEGAMRELLEETGVASWTSAGAVDRTEWVNQLRTTSTILPESEPSYRRAYA